MTLLLDTHVLLWALMAPQRLSPGLRAALTQPETRVQFSAASVWEIAIKRALGRPDFAFEPGTVAQAALDTDFEPLPVRHEHAARVRHLPPLHADPFDRLLLALCRFVLNATALSDGRGGAERVSGQVLQA